MREGGRGAWAGRREAALAREWPLATLLGVLFFALYAARACPTLCLLGDSGELVTAAALWGVPHAPGYPLWTAIGHAFAALPMGSIPWRVHLSSACFHAATVVAVAVATRALTGSRVAAIAAACALGLSRTFVLGSLYAEVFPLNDLIFASLLAIAFRLREGRAGDGAPVMFAACAGLGAAHHMMIVLAAPALAVLAGPSLVAYARGRARRAVWLVVALAGPPLAAYALVPLAASRSPYLSWGDVRDLRSLADLVLRADYGGPLRAVRHASAESGASRVAAFARTCVSSFGGPVLLVAVLGAIRELIARRAAGVALLLAFVLSGPCFAWFNAVPTASTLALASFARFTTMAHVPLAIAFGAGVAAVESHVARTWPARTRGAGLARTGAAALLAASFAPVVYRARDVTLAGDTLGLTFAHDVVASPPAGSLVLLTGDQPANAAFYVCGVERLCGDRVVLSPGMLSRPWRMAQVRRQFPDLTIPWAGGPALARTHEIVAAAIEQRPVFVHPDLLEKDPVLATAFDAVPDGLLVRLWKKDRDAATRRATFVASARALAEGTCAGREGSAIERSHQKELVEAYRTACANHASFARSLLADQGGGASMSR